MGKMSPKKDVVAQVVELLPEPAVKELLPMRCFRSKSGLPMAVLIPTVLVLALLVPAGSFAIDTKKVNPSISRSVDRHFDKTPDKRARETIKKNNHLIEYFAGLYYTRVKYRVDPDYIRALICVESGGDPKAVSPRNARGLTQILPETGKRWAKMLYDSKFDFKYIDERRLENLRAEDLFDPATNILLACLGTDLYNKKYEGNIALVGSAWNAGPYSIKKYDDSPPYDETINFVGRINGYMQYFRKTRQASGKK